MTVETYHMLSELPRWRLSLMAAGRKPATIKNYLRAVEQFDAFLTAQEIDTDTATITRDHIRAWTVWLTQDQQQAPSTVALYWKSLSVFFSWAEAEGIIERTPFYRVKAPTVAPVYKEVLRPEQIRQLVMRADGRSFTHKRNVAALYVLFDTGARISEFLGLKVADWDPMNSTLILRYSKTRPRQVRLGAAAGVALSRYLRLRNQHPWAASDALWLGRQGPWTDSGCRGFFQDLQTETGIDIHPHALRHAWAHSVMASGVPTPAIMHAGGWTSTKMLTDVYAVSLAEERSVALMNGHSPADSL